MNQTIFCRPKIKLNKLEGKRIFHFNQTIEQSFGTFLHHMV